MRARARSAGEEWGERTARSRRKKETRACSESGDERSVARRNKTRSEPRRPAGEAASRSAGNDASRADDPARGAVLSSEGRGIVVVAQHEATSFVLARQRRPEVVVGRPSRQHRDNASSREETPSGKDPSVLIPVSLRSNPKRRALSRDSPHLVRFVSGHVFNFTC